MEPDTPPRSRRSSILKVTRPPPPRSPLQSLEANQDAQDEDRTTVTRSFKRRVSFSRTNKVQEFCLENPQAWGEAYEKELSPEPSTLLQRGSMAAFPLETTSSLQELLSSEIKSAPSFCLGSSVFKTASFVEVTRSSSMQVVSLPATVTSGALTSTEGSDDDMDITAPNAAAPTLAPVPQLHLGMDKENLQAVTKVLPDFLHKSFSDRSNLSAMMMDTTGAFPSNVNLEPDDYDLSPKKMCMQNMLNQTRIEDSAMEMSTSSVTDEGNSDIGKLVESVNKSFKLPDKTMNESLNMDMTVNFTRPLTFGNIDASIYAPNKTLNTSALDMTGIGSSQLQSQEFTDKMAQMKQQQNETAKNDLTLLHTTDDNVMEITNGILSHTNKSIDPQENSAMETTGIASKTLEKSSLDTTCNGGENTSCISDMMLTKLADTSNLSSMQTSQTYKAADPSKNTSNHSMDFTSVNKPSQTILDVSNIVLQTPQVSNQSYRLEKSTEMNKSLNDASVMDITKIVDLNNRSNTNQTTMSETIPQEPSTSNAFTTSERINKFFGPHGLPTVDNIEISPPVSPFTENQTGQQSFEMDITDVTKPMGNSTASQKLNQTFTKSISDSTVLLDETLPQHIEIKETVVTKTSSPSFDKTINYEKIKITDKLENQTCEMESCKVVETIKETCVSPTAETEIQVTKVHITEDLEDVHINDKTGEISRKVKHMEIRETIECTSPIPQDDLEPESQGTKVELNSRQELYLSPVTANQRSDVATLVTRPSSKQSSPLQMLPKKILFTENTSPKNIFSKDEYKRSGDCLEEESPSRKKSCQMEQASTSKTKDVPEIIITNATPTETETFVIPSPKVATTSKENEISRSADMTIPDSDMEVDLSQTKNIPLSTSSSSMELDLSQTKTAHSTGSTEMDLNQTKTGHSSGSTEMDLNQTKTGHSSGSTEMDLNQTKTGHSSGSTEMDLNQTKTGHSSGSTEMDLNQTKTGHSSGSTEMDLNQTKTGHSSGSTEMDLSQVTCEGDVLLSSGSSDVFLPDIVVERATSENFDKTGSLDETKDSGHKEKKHNKHHKKSQGPEKNAKKLCTHEQPDMETEEMPQPEEAPTKPTGPLTAEEQIREDIKSMKSVWRVHHLSGLQWKFVTLRGSMLLNLQLTDDGQVNKAEFVANPAGIPSSRGKCPGLAWQFCQSLLLARFPAESLAQLWTADPSVLALLKGLQPTLDSLTALARGLENIAFFHLINLSGTTMTFIAHSLPMMLLLNVSVDLAHWDTLSLENVSVTVVRGPLKENEIMDMMPNMPSNGELLPKFVEEVLEYVKMLEKFSVNSFNQSVCAEH